MNVESYHLSILSTLNMAGTAGLNGADLSAPLITGLAKVAVAISKQTHNSLEDMVEIMRAELDEAVAYEQRLWENPCDISGPN